jgi:hypothetical protein
VAAPFGRERLTLESVVQVRVAAAHERPQARQQVGGDEPRAPALALRDVCPLVVARLVERPRIARDHDVAKRERQRPAPDRHETAQDPSQQGAVGLEHASHDPALASRRGE